MHLSVPPKMLLMSIYYKIIKDISLMSGLLFFLHLIPSFRFSCGTVGSGGSWRGGLKWTPDRVGMAMIWSSCRSSPTLLTSRYCRNAVPKILYFSKWTQCRVKKTETTACVQSLSCTISRTDGRSYNIWSYLITAGGKRFISYYFSRCQKNLYYSYCFLFSWVVNKSSIRWQSWRAWPLTCWWAAWSVRQRSCSLPCLRWWLWTLMTWGPSNSTWRSRGSKLTLILVLLFCLFNSRDTFELSISSTGCLVELPVNTYSIIIVVSVVALNSVNITLWFSAISWRTIVITSYRS